MLQRLSCVGFGGLASGHHNFNVEASTWSGFVRSSPSDAGSGKKLMPQLAVSRL